MATPDPDIAVQGTSLPKGAGTAVEAGTDVAREAAAADVTPAEALEETAGARTVEGGVPAVDDSSLDEFDEDDPEDDEDDEDVGLEQEETFTPRGDDLLLFGPTSRPTEGLRAGITSNSRVPLPADIFDWLPSLTMLVQQPDAPEQAKALLRLIVYHMENQ